LAVRASADAEDDRADEQELPPPAAKTTSLNRFCRRSPSHLRLPHQAIGRR